MNKSNNASNVDNDAEENEGGKDLVYHWQLLQVKMSAIDINAASIRPFDDATIKEANFKERMDISAYGHETGYLSVSLDGLSGTQAALLWKKCSEKDAAFMVENTEFKAGLEQLSEFQISIIDGRLRLWEMREYYRQLGQPDRHIDVLWWKRIDDKAMTTFDRMVVAMKCNLNSKVSLPFSDKEWLKSLAMIEKSIVPADIEKTGGPARKGHPSQTG